MCMASSFGVFGVIIVSVDETLGLVVILKRESILPGS